MTRPTLPRPTLIPGLHRTWRDSRTIQLGAHPSRAHLLDLPDPSAAAVLDLLDGSRPERAILRRAAALGLSPRDTRALLEALHRAGLIMPAASLLPPALDESTRTRLSSEAAALALTPDPAGQALTPDQARRALIPDSAGQALRADSAGRALMPDPAARALMPGPAAGAPMPGPAARSPASVLRHRRSARILLSGSSRLAAGVAVALAEAGIGHIHADVPGTVTAQNRIGSPLRDTDIGRPHTEAITALIHQAAPTTETRSVRRGSPSLVIQFGFTQPVALLAAGHAQREQPYLPVTIREAVPVIGPLVPARGGPCLHCLALHRRDRDTEAAATTSPFAGSAAPEIPCSPAGTNYAPANADPVMAEPPDATSTDAGLRDARSIHGGPHNASLFEPCAVATLLAATAYVVGEALAFIDGSATATLGAEVEISGPGRFRRRSWTAHPACFCAPMRSVSRSSRGRPSVQGGRSAFSRSQ